MYSYRQKPLPRAANQTELAANHEQAKATVQARTDLYKDSQDATQAAAQSLQYMAAAKAIMDSKGAAVGATAIDRESGRAQGVGSTRQKALAAGLVFGRLKREPSSDSTEKSPEN